MRQVIQKWEGVPFRYGADCCVFVGECLESMGQRNPMELFSYKTRAEAEQIIREWGGIRKAVSAFLGQPYDGIKDGDVCVIDDNQGGEAVAIVYSGRIVARTPHGLMDYPLSRALCVWDVKWAQ